MIERTPAFPNSSVLPSIEGAFWYRARPNGDDASSCTFDVFNLRRVLHQYICADAT